MVRSQTTTIATCGPSTRFIFILTLSLRARKLQHWICISHAFGWYFLGPLDFNGHGCLVCVKLPLAAIELVTRKGFVQAGTAVNNQAKSLCLLSCTPQTGPKAKVVHKLHSNPPPHFFINKMGQLYEDTTSTTVTNFHKEKQQLKRWVSRWPSNYTA